MNEASYDALNLQYNDVDSRANANPDLGAAAERYHHDEYSFREALSEKPFEYHGRVENPITFNDNMTNVNTSIVFTHSHRLRCIFTLLCGDKYDSSYRFKNNSVILLRLTPVEGYVINTGTTQFKYDIKLLVNGTDDDSENKGQWCLQSNDRNSDREFESLEGFNNFKSLRPYEPMFSEKKQEIEIKKIEYIYLVRHGKAEHNEKDYSLMRHIGWNDTNLLADQESVKEAALQIYKYMIKIKTREITTLCVSDLRRTQQTFEIFMKQFIAKNNQNVVSNGIKSKNPDQIGLPHRVIVLPCSHELTYVKNGRCDGDMKQQFNIKSPFTAENRTAYFSPNLKSMNQHLVKNQDLYDNMYGSTKRGIFHYINPFKGNNRCRFTSFLELLVKYNSKFDNPIGISYQEENNTSSRDSVDTTRSTFAWRRPKGGRSRRKSRRKSIRKRSKKRRN